MPSNETERPSGDVGIRLTYAEIATRLGISGDAARQLVRRRGWLRIVPNRRGATTTVIVPEGELAGEQWRDTRPANDGGTTPDGDRSELRSALTLVDRLSSQLAEANKRVDATLALLANANTERAEAQLRAMQAEVLIANLKADLRLAEVRADMAETATAAEGARVDALRDRLTTMQEQLADAHAALQAAEVATTRAQQAEASRDTERQRADRAEQGREADRARSDVLQARLDDVQVQLTARREVIDAAEAIRRADDARLARGRLRRAWDGWRGR